MKRIVALMVVAAAASACFAQYRAVDRQAGMMVEGRPFFTDAARYNSYDLAGSPLGIFETDPSKRMNVDVGYGYYGFGDESGHYLSGQKLRMGQPGRTFFEVFYGPDILSYKGGSSKTDLPLHRFGLTLATQAADGFFRSSIRAEGYVGGQTWENGDSSRAIMGFEALRLDLGSQVHPLVRLVFFVDFTLNLDTLCVPGNAERADRSAHINLPEFGINVGFGGEDIPVRSNLTVSYALSRFVYTSKPIDQSTVPTVDPLYGNANPIMSDSLRLTLLAQGEFLFNENYTVKPGMIVGVSNVSGKQHQPHEENDPLQPGSAVPDTDFSLSGIYFGAGTGFAAHKYADLHVEYTAAFMSLDCDSRYSAPPVKLRTLHRTSFGVSTLLNNYLELPLNITPRIAYFISGESGGVGAVHSGLDPLNVIPGKSKASLYAPQYFLAGFERTRGFTLGVDGVALEDRLSASVWMTFLSKEKADKSGMELGLSAGFSM